jgi:hypothetical protein
MRALQQGLSGLVWRRGPGGHYYDNFPPGQALSESEMEGLSNEPFLVLEPRRER